MDKIIGIGQYYVSDNHAEIIKTFALASCVAVTVYSKRRGASGMIHIALPEPTGVIQSERNGYFATTGLPLLLQCMQTQFGCHLNELEIKVFGGADSIKPDDHFLIGQKNLESIKRYLMTCGLEYRFEDVGGYLSRTIEMNVGTGHIKMSTQVLRI